MAVIGFAAVLQKRICVQRSKGYQMNARMKKAVRPYGGPFVISARKPEGLQQGGWTRFQRTLERIRLLLSSPIASFRWARAKRKSAAGKKGTGTSERKGRWFSTFADYERDGIVMGF